jgi:hypothetical protein
MIWKSRYVRYLEEELERERDENRRLWDALLLKNGMPALTPPGPRIVAKQSSRPLPSQFMARIQKAFRGAASAKTN